MAEPTLIEREFLDALWQELADETGQKVMGKQTLFRIVDELLGYRERHSLDQQSLWLEAASLIKTLTQAVETESAKLIEWTEPEPPNADSSYHHIIGKCGPIKFLVEWKGWKDYPSYSMEVSIDGPFIGVGSLEHAKREAVAWIDAIRARSTQDKT